LYAASFEPSTGWSAPAKIVAQLLEDPDLQLGIGIDAAGNGLVVWKADAAKGFASSVMESGSQAWSGPAAVVGSDAPGCSAAQARLVVGAGAVLAWSRTCAPVGSTALGTREVWASRWTAVGGWETPASMVVGDVEFALAGNESGDAQIAWIIKDAGSVPSSTTASIHARRFIAVTGWTAVQTVANGLTRQPRQPRLAINVQGAAVLAWANAFDASVSTTRRDQGGAWTQPLDLYRPAHLFAGDPTVLQPSMTDDGRALVPWIVSDLMIVGQVVTARYLPGAGWDPSTVLVYTGRRGLVKNVELDFDRQGRGAIVWLEGAAAGFNLYANTLTF
jgi:hypothetical protein